MAEISINGSKRTNFGKGASRRDRRDGNVPAVIYGHGEAPKHVALPGRELLAALKKPRPSPHSHQSYPTPLTQKTKSWN